jgi:hypothetical protein
MTFMNNNKFKIFILTGLMAFTFSRCKDQLDIKNPNAPTVSSNVTTESGLISLAQGGVYYDGFSDGLVWLGDSYFSLPWAYHEIMADLLGADASNNQVTTIGIPQYFILDNGTKVINQSSSSIGIIKTYNSRAATGAGNNVLYYQWLSSYALNNSANLVLSLVDKVKYTGDAASKISTLKAWSYWWKGFAYQQIGTMYYSGVLVDEYGKVSNEYVLHDEIINRSNYYFSLAATTLGEISTVSDYQTVLGKLIPLHTQVGHGGVLSIDMWKRNINTMLARNILLNKLAPFVNGNPNATISKSSISSMTAADWNSVLTLATNGIAKGDFIFTGRTTGTNDFFSASSGFVGVNSIGDNLGSTLKIGERLIQNFKPGDKRFTNNFYTGKTYNNSFTYTTRYSLYDGGKGIPGVYTYANSTAGKQEITIAGSYEENALMLAEANIRLNNINAGLGYVDAVRDYLGAGVPAVSGTGLTLAGALTELVKERRVSLFFRGLSFYDSRRWGWTYDIADGGGSYGNTLVQNSGTVNTNVTMDYNFMDYWDVPQDETVLNKPSATSAPIENPNYSK